mmetsp:Transcript_19573/g.34563  ORF Transcript_19573/g.34563 Transcript_19573/m.34563 type:complete len:215 (+) Transcript_19573:471-1115(+)
MRQREASTHFTKYFTLSRRRKYMLRTCVISVRMPINPCSASWRVPLAKASAWAISGRRSKTWMLVDESLLARSCASETKSRAVDLESETQAATSWSQPLKESSEQDMYAKRQVPKYFRSRSQELTPPSPMPVSVSLSSEAMADIAIVVETSSLKASPASFTLMGSLEIASPLSAIGSGRTAMGSRLSLQSMSLVRAGSNCSSTTLPESIAKTAK